MEFRTLLTHEGINAGISFTRPDGRPNFSNSELQTLDMLMPHFARAFKTHFHLLEVEQENSVANDALSRLTRGLMVLDRNGKVVFMNTSARELLDQGDGLEIDARGSVRASSPNGRLGLRNALDKIFAADKPDGENFGGGLLIHRPSGLRPMELFLEPFTKNTPFNFVSERLVLVFVTDPEASLANTEDLLTEMYGLTPAEAHIAQLLVDGKTIEDVREELEITRNTARTHLKHIFSKTQTNRQSALMKLILSGPANIRRKKKICPSHPFG